jgi:fructokinase
MDIICLGELLVDMFPSETGKRLSEVPAFIPKPGGGPANAAVAAARLGASCAFIGKVGQDSFGEWLIDTLSNEGVNVDGARFDEEARTTMAFIAKPDVNTAEFVFYRNPGADIRLTPAELDRDLLSATRCLHFGSLSLTHEPARSATREAIETIRGSDALISYDVNYRPSLWESATEAISQAQAMLPLVDLVKVNDDELHLLTGSRDLETAPRMILDRGPSICIVTMGPEGSHFCTSKASGTVSPFTVQTVDATGCGDAFIAGLLSRLVREGNWREKVDSDSMMSALRYANAVGALTATKLGVFPALPTASQVDEFLKDF